VDVPGEVGRDVRAAVDCVLRSNAAEPAVEYFGAVVNGISIRIGAYFACDSARNVVVRGGLEALRHARFLRKSS
jgi:hypothetical protein